MASDQPPPNLSDPGLPEQPPPGEPPRAGRRDMVGLGLLMLAAVSWASTALFVKYLSGHYGNLTQNFYRYAFAATLLWIIARRLCPGELRRHARYWRRFVPMIAAASVFQVLMVAGLYHLDPGYVSLIGNTTVIFTALLAFTFLPEERPVIRTARYLAGTALAVACAAGLVLSAPSGDGRGINWWALCIVACSALWAAYTIMARKLLRDANSMVSFTYVGTGTAVVMGVTACLIEDLTAVVQAPAISVAALAVSGWVCIGVAHSAFFAALRRLGAAFCGVFLLICPVLTNVLSHLIYGERITFAQAVLGVGILAGAYQTLAARRRFGR